jgi:hypothetical protein
MALEPFRDHQLRVLQYMFQVRPGQKGLVVSHYMGTGKTITGLGFLMQYASRGYKLTVVHPDGLDHIWSQDARVIGASVQDIQFIPYKFLVEQLLGKGEALSDRVIVFDEAHKLALLLQSLPEQKAQSVYNVLVSAHRLLLLTGTPIYDSEADFRWLINVAAGKPVLPMGTKQFQLKYFKTNRIASFMYQWTRPLFYLATPLLATWDVRENATFLWRVLEQGLNTLIKQTSKKNSAANNSAAREKKYEPIFGKIMTGKALNWQETEEFYDYHKDLETKQQGSNKEWKQLVQDMKHTSLTKAAKILNQVFGTTFGENENDVKAYTSLGVYFAVLAVVLAVVLATHITFPTTFRELDVEKLMTSCGQYISIHELPDVSTDKSSDFPSIAVERVPVPYNAGQMTVWVALTMRSTDDEMLSKIMPPTTSGEGVFLFGDRYIDSQENWCNYGRIIGNLTEGDEVPPKFLRILEKFLAPGIRNRTVVYSSFWEKGCLLFGKFLESRGISFEYIHVNAKASEKVRILDGFLRGDIPIVILHPELTEGLTIKGAKQMHVLEPLTSYAKQQQLIARVQRYQSHAMLPIQERHVEIFIWYSSVTGPLQFIRRHFSSMKHWLKTEANMNYFNRTMDFVQDATPDFLAMKELNRLEKVVNSLKQNQTLSSNANVRRAVNTRQLKPCCLWLPDQDAVARCMSRGVEACVQRKGQRSNYKNDINSARNSDSSYSNINGSNSNNAAKRFQLQNLNPQRTNNAGKRTNNGSNNATAKRVVQRPQNSRNGAVAANNVGRRNNNNNNNNNVQRLQNSRNANSGAAANELPPRNNVGRRNNNNNNGSNNATAKGIKRPRNSRNTNNANAAEEWYDAPQQFQRND